MSSRGFVYALINPGMPGLVKIGKTTRAVEERVREISSSTGVPYPYVCAYSIEVSDCHLIEKELHKEFDRYRANSSREFFTVDLQKVIRKMYSIEEIELKEAELRKKKIIEENKLKEIKLEKKKIVEENNLIELKVLNSINKFNKYGYNKEGFHKEGFHKDTKTKYNRFGFDINGFDINGFHKDTKTKYNRLGYNINGFHKEGIHKDTRTNYDANGFDINGFHKDTKINKNKFIYKEYYTSESKRYLDKFKK